MKFKLDENMPAELLLDLRSEGHDVQSVLDEGMKGSPDLPILDAIRREGRILFTLDKGIADVRRHPPSQYPGIVLFRPKTAGRGAVLAFVRNHLSVLLGMDFPGHPFVVTERGIRRR